MNRKFTNALEEVTTKLLITTTLAISRRFMPKKYLKINSPIQMKKPSKKHPTNIQHIQRKILLK